MVSEHSEYGLQAGTADIRSAGPIAFGPDGILFLADNAAARVYAVGPYTILVWNKNLLADLPR